MMTTETTLTAFAKVLSTAPNHTDTILVPGHDGAQYEVIVRRTSGQITTECLRRTAIGSVPCKGNSKSVCYHSRIAISRVASERGKSIAFCNSLKFASKLSRLGGSIVRVVSKQSGITRYGVVK